MSHFLSVEGLSSLVALTFLEIVLGIDNIVVVAVAVLRLREEERSRGSRIGIMLAMVLRILMLFGLVWITRLAMPLFTVLRHAFTVKDIVLIAGGLFLLFKGTTEIHDTIEEEPEGDGDQPEKVYVKLIPVVIHIGLINIVFSLDTVITAVGMTSDLPVMIGAVVLSSAVMLFAAGPVGRFIQKRPTTKMLALSFILLVGVALLGDGLGFHLPRGYLYFAIAFSLFVEMLNGAYRRSRPR